MGTMDYFPAFFKYRRSLKDLTDEQVGRVFRAALEYGEDGTIPRLSAVEKMAFAFIMSDIDVARGKYEEICGKRRDAVNKRWQNNGEQTATNEYKCIEEIQKNSSDTKHTDIQTDRHTDIISDSVAAPAADTPARTKPQKKQFTPPTADDVRAYCEEQGITVDAERFIDYYAANGWKVGSQGMKDWRATVRNWARRDRERGYTDKPQETRGKANKGFSEPSFDTDEFFDAALQRTYGDSWKLFKDAGG